LDRKQCSDIHNELSVCLKLFLRDCPELCLKMKRAGATKLAGGFHTGESSNNQSSSKGTKDGKGEISASVSPELGEDPVGSEE
jgi:hypothetical protein